MTIENCGACADYICAFYGCRKYRLHHNPTMPNLLPQQVPSEMQFDTFANIVAAKVVELLEKKKRERRKR